MLITTRSRMPDLASSQLVDLNVLDDDEALVLFTKVVGDERVTAEPEATAELLLACAGLPLAIRICAARLATRPGWTIRAMAGLASNEQRRLDEMRVGDLAVRASFQVSFTSLPAAAQPGDIAPADAFRMLGLWHGPSVSSAAAAALFGTAEYLAEDALELLVDAHLLEAAESGRYKFHDLLRVYASERAVADLSGSDRDAAVGRLLGWYMYTADAAAAAVLPSRYKIPLETTDHDVPALAFPSAQAALAWYDSERVNVVAATRQAAVAGLPDIAWRLPVPLLNIFDSRGGWADLIATHRVALEAARQTGNQPGEAWVLNNLGLALAATSDSEGLRCLEQSLELRREIGDRLGEAQSAGNLADAYTRLGRPEEAIELFVRCRDLSREVGNRYGEGVAQTNLGAALLDLGGPPRRSMPWRRPGPDSTTSECSTALATPPITWAALTGRSARASRPWIPCSRPCAATRRPAAATGRRSRCPRWPPCRPRAAWWPRPAGPGARRRPSSMNWATRPPRPGPGPIRPPPSKPHQVIPD